MADNIANDVVNNVTDNVTDNDVIDKPKKIIWKKKEAPQGFPFMNGSKILFDFLIRPYLDDRTLGLIAGTCVAAREYVCKDLETYWFQKYLELYDRGVVEKYVRNVNCCTYCFGNYNGGYHTYTRKEEYDANEIWWDDVPISIYNLAKADGYNSFRHKYEGKYFCKHHFVPKYFGANHKANKSKKRSHMNYYKKVMFYSLYNTNATTLTNKISRAQNEYNMYKNCYNGAKIRLETLKKQQKFLEIIKN